MTAFFIGLPIKKDASISELNIGKGIKTKLVVNTVKKVGQGGAMVSSAPFPSGIGARRILLYIFNYRYSNPTKILRLSEKSNNAFLRKMGYNFGRTAMSNHPGIAGLKSLTPCSFQLGNEEFNQKIGISKLIMTGYNLRMGLEHKLLSDATSLKSEIKRRTTPDEFTKYEGFLDSDENRDSIFLHPFFAFRLDVPVDFSLVAKSTKKSEFWNVYVFLADILPRVKKGKSLPVPWKDIHTIFQRRYGDEGQFRYFFKKILQEVFTVYPQAKSRVDTSNKEHLILKHTPAPI